MKQRVAIIIVTYNGSDYIGDCLSSLEKIHYPKEQFEVIIVDNNSTDNSLEIIEKHSLQATSYKLQANTGFVGGNNIGIQYAIEHGFDFVYLLNQDTEVEADFLDKAVDAANTDENIAAVQSRLMYAKDKGRINSLGGMIHFLGFGFAKGNTEKMANGSPRSPRGAAGGAAGKWLASLASRRSGRRSGQMANEEIVYPSGAGVLIRSSVLKKLGSFQDAFFSYYEDAELGWRMWLAGYRVILAPGSVVYHKYDFSRSTKSYYWMERNRYLMILQNYTVATLLLIAPALFIMEILILARSFLTRTWVKRIKVYNYLTDLENWKKILYNRKHISQIRKVKEKEILARFTGKILYQEEQSTIVRYIINPLFNAYFTIVRIIVFW